MYAMHEHPGVTEHLRVLRTLAARWSWLVAATGAALFALRVSLEAAPQRLPWGLGAAVVCILAASGLRAARPTFSLRSLALLWLYVIWPARSPAMALAVGFVGGGGLVVHNLPLRPGEARWALFWDGPLFLAALALYLATLAPDMLPADSGEFQIVGPLLGVAHPPGYALFTLLAKGFSLIPIQTMTWRLNAMGAVTGALTLVVVARTARRMTSSPWAGVAAATALGLSTTFWAQSTTINIRMLSVLSTALCLSALVRYLLAPVASEESVRALTGLAAAFGLAVAHTAWPAFFAPVFAIAILWRDPTVLRRTRYWPRYLAAFFLPFVGHLYIAVRAATGAPFGAEELVNAGRVVDHLLGRGFGGDMFAFLRLDRLLWERILVLGNILRFQFGLPLLLIALTGFAGLAHKRRRIAFLLGGLFLTMAFIVATYRAPQSVEYLMPAYLPIALSVGATVAQAASLGRRAKRLSKATTVGSLLLAALLYPIFLLGRAHWPSYRMLHHDRSTRAYAESVLLQAPRDAHVLSNWHWYTPLRYLQLVEGRRLDVQVTYLFPQGATAMPQAWPERIERELEAHDRPLIVTNYYPTYGDLPYRFAPLGEAFRVLREPSSEIPHDLKPIEVALSEEGDAVIRLIGFRLYDEADLYPGRQVTVDLVWQPLVQLERPYALFVHLVRSDGVPLGQRDRRHGRATGYEPGEILIDRYQFPVHPTAPPGTYRLIAGAYIPFDDGSWKRLTSAQGQDTTVLSEIEVAPAPRPPVTLHPLHVPYNGTPESDGPTLVGPTLVGSDYDDTLPGQRRAYLHWQAGTLPAIAELYVDGQMIAQARAPVRSAGEQGALANRGYATTALDLPPGTRHLQIGVQRDGRPLPARGAWGIPIRSPRPLPDPGPEPVHYMPFGGKLALIGVRVDGAWVQGEQGRVVLNLLGLQPIVRDYVVSIGASGTAVTDAPSDSVPAIGAIPTFKWVRGSVVSDAHLIQVLGSGEAELTMGIYDAFTTTALSPLDERFARQGRAGVPLRKISIP
jgi:hypothetical protein